jgi:hypothetical protein
MKIKIIQIIQIAAILMFLGSCMPGSKKKVANLAPNAHQVTAVEVVQTSAYSYVRVVEDKKDYWIAINRMDIKEGETYFWSEGAEMTNFTSKELKRTFPSIFFIQDFTDKPILTRPQVPLTSMAGKQKPPQVTDINVPKVEGGVTIAEVYSKKSALQGKTIKIRGEVVKFASQIMKKNWVHLQDGTRDGDNYDLAVTTLDSVKKGDVVIFEGVLNVNKDFGYGYIYDVILEDARLKK